jgi:hypothetical protein
MTEKKANFKSQYCSRKEIIVIIKTLRTANKIGNFVIDSK